MHQLNSLRFRKWLQSWSSLAQQGADVVVRAVGRCWVVEWLQLLREVVEGVLIEISDISLLKTCKNLGMLQSEWKQTSIESCESLFFHGHC